MSENLVDNSEMTEKIVVDKVAELLETLDHIKKYNALTKAFKNFVLIVIGSHIIFLTIGASIGFLNLGATLDKPQLFFGSMLLILIPIIGIIAGIVFVQRKIDSIKTGEWKNEISQGFPSALKFLLEIDWDETFDEISSGRVSYALYVALKLIAYLIITFFSLALITNSLLFLIGHQLSGGNPIVGFVSLLLVYLLLRKDISSRYQEIKALDKLLWELRWFSVELKEAQFET
ncbi:MAG: hypothetical protein ACOWW1_10945 [archaeon]|nr:hypothetical protein [Candidatus Bathyarchaeum sp.]